MPEERGDEPSAPCTVGRVDTAANLAARYRPRRFAELTGQRHIAAVLTGAVKAGKFPQQLLLTGGSGLGKTTVARIAAAAQLCTADLQSRSDADACGTCESCRMVTAAVSEHPDVIEMDAASHGGKDEIVELVGRAHTRPLIGHNKVYIIDEVHALSSAGVQAFLKLLEEPPAHVMFMLATTNPEKLSSRAGGAGTIRSRCLELELLPPAHDELVDNLLRIAAGEHWQLSRPQAGWIIDAADPKLGVRGTVNLLARLSGRLAAGTPVEDHELSSLLGTLDPQELTRLTDAIRAGDLASALSTVTLLRRRTNEQTIRDALARWARQDLEEALVGRRALSPLVPLQRLERIIGSGDGPLNTDLLVARLTTPAVVADPETLAAQLHEARRVIIHLEQLLRTSQQTTTPAGPAGLPSRPSEPATSLPEVGAGTTQAALGGTISDRLDEPDIGGSDGPVTGDAAAGPPGGNDRQAADPVAGTFEDLSDLAPPSSLPEPGRIRDDILNVSRLAVAVWDASQVQFTPGQVTVTVPAALAIRARTAQGVWQQILTAHQLTCEVNVEQ